MTFTKEKHKEFVIASQKKLASFNTLTVKGATYTQKSIGKYTSIFQGKNGAEYIILVSGSYYVMKNQNLAVYEISRKGKTLKSFVIYNNQIVSL